MSSPCLGYTSIPSSFHLPLGHNPRERTERNPEMIEIKLLQFLGGNGIQNRNVKSRAKLSYFVVIVHLSQRQAKCCKSGKGGI